MSSNHELKYPIALSRASDELTNAKDAQNCKCYCIFCKRDMIAIIGDKKQRAHFRHESDSNCAASYESYIHWLAKEIFKELSTFNLPDLTYEDLGRDFHIKIQSLYNKFHVPTDLAAKFDVDILQLINSKLKNFSIEKVEIEKQYRHDEATVRIDVVLFSKKQTLFIEPYLTNPISPTKYNILEDLNISTIDISLATFLNKNHLYTKDQLKDFLVNDLNSKRWRYYKKHNDYFAALMPQIEKILQNNKNILAYYHELIEKIKGTERNVAQTYRQIDELDASIRREFRIKVGIEKELEALRLKI